MNEIPMENEEKRKYFEELVKHPGKFQNEQSYVPYFWEVFLDGCADYIDSETLSFIVTAEDIAIFPSLENVKRINLVETNDGFVEEI